MFKQSRKRIWNFKMNYYQRSNYLKTIEKYSIIPQDPYIKYIPDEIIYRYTNIYWVLDHFLCKNLILKILEYIKIDDLDLLFKFKADFYQLHRN